MRVLVTGGAGFIGSHIVDLLLTRGHEVLIVDDLSSGRRENINPQAKIVCCDIVDDQFLDSTSHFRPDAICHQAAQPSLRKSIDDPVYDACVNIIGTLKVIQAARSVNAHVVMASTSAVYDPSGQLPYLESDPIGPRLPYGIAKASAEMYLMNSGLNAAVLRYGNVYGPRQIKVGENQLVPHCLGYLLHGDLFIINGDGSRTRDFVYVGDIARANVDAIERNVTGTYNVATGTGRSVIDVCMTLAMLTIGFTTFEFGPEKSDEADHVRLDIHKAAHWWHPTIELEEGLRITV